jgi:hypothetical protein
MKLCPSPANKKRAVIFESGIMPRKTKVTKDKEAEDPSPTFKFVPTVVPLPFCYGHSMFYQFFRQICKDEGDSIVLAGSSALERRMMDHHGCSAFQPNDVDFFTSAHLIGRDVFDYVKEFNNIQSEYTLEVVQIRLPHTYPQYHNNGVHSIYNFRLSQNLGANWCTPLVLPGPQLICMQASRYGGRDLNRFVEEVLDSFDISVCKCAILDPLAMENVYTVADGDIKKKVLEYDLRNFTSADVMRERLQKYTDRGFDVDRIRIGRKVIVEASIGYMRMFTDYKQERDGTLGKNTQNRFDIDVNDF